MGDKYVLRRPQPHIKWHNKYFTFKVERTSGVGFTVFPAKCFRCVKSIVTIHFDRNFATPVRFYDVGGTILSASFKKVFVV